MTPADIALQLLASRRSLSSQNTETKEQTNEVEGGCGVIGMASSVQIAGRHMLQSLEQMRNRGNGKGGGIAAVGLVPEEFGVSAEILENDYLLTVAYLQNQSRSQIEASHIHPTFEVDHIKELDSVKDFREIPGIEVAPPQVVCYFVRVKPEVVEKFRQEHKLPSPSPYNSLEDEIVYQNSYQLNQTYYATTGEKHSFVLSHGKNILVLKMVGYGEDVVRYYKLENTHAHVWIGHHRYPTKGKMWHPGGAHPFVGLNEALVHNGDFANYASICTYLEQQNIKPLFHTDTEVAALLFDLHHRMYGYPLEYVIESFAPTTELDFSLLPPEKQKIYRLLQTSHIHGSPDGPWFFLIAQSDTHEATKKYRLLGITDTSMLRPQVFALQKGKATIGLAASEKQAIDAALTSLSEVDDRFWPRADAYWNARGGSYTDGGAFQFTIEKDEKGESNLLCTNKFSEPIDIVKAATPYFQKDLKKDSSSEEFTFSWKGDVEEIFQRAVKILGDSSQKTIQSFLHALKKKSTENRDLGLKVLTLLLDRNYSLANLRRSRFLCLLDEILVSIIQNIRENPCPEYICLPDSGECPDPQNEKQTLVVDGKRYDIEGDKSLARKIIEATQKFRRFLILNIHGHRFIGNGFGPDSKGIQIDVYGSAGDYLASGIDGAEINLHGDGQDQLGQIMKSGKLVIHGDVGQAFMYGAKGGNVFIRGNAAGRPLINAVGKPRVVINGTCLDYLAESFMAGDPLQEGGFVILNGIGHNSQGQIYELETCYAGGNLFSLASGGAIYARDPHKKLIPVQLNGGVFTELTDPDWDLIRPYLEENERLFGISLDYLLTVDGEKRSPQEVYRKIQPSKTKALQAEEAWVATGSGH